MDNFLVLTYNKLLSTCQKTLKSLWMKFRILLVNAFRSWIYSLKTSFHYYKRIIHAFRLKLITSLFMFVLIQTQKRKFCIRGFVWCAEFNLVWLFIWIHITLISPHISLFLFNNWGPMISEYEFVALNWFLWTVYKKNNLRIYIVQRSLSKCAHMPTLDNFQLFSMQR